MNGSISGDYRWRRFGRAAAGLLPTFFMITWTGFWSLSGEVSYASGAAGVLTLAAAVSTVLTARAAWAPRLTPRWHLNMIVISWSLTLALTAALILVTRGMPALPAAGCAVAAGTLAAMAYDRQRSRVAALQPVFLLSVETLSDAELLRAATEQPNDDPRVPADQKAIQRLNHARALTILAMRNGDFDRLVEALPTLRTVLQDPRLDPAVALVAARDLVEAQSLLAQHGGDGGRYAASIELYAQLARENPKVPGTGAVLHACRAGYQQYLMTGAAADLKTALAAGDDRGATQAEQRIRAAWFTIERELTCALRLTPGQADVVPEYLTELGVHLSSAWTCVGEDRSDEGVDLCRRALSLRAGRTRGQRPHTELALALALTDRYEQAGDNRDAAEAEALLRGLVRQGNPIEARAREMLVRIALLRPEGRLCAGGSLSAGGGLSGVGGPGWPSAPATTFRPGPGQRSRLGWRTRSPT
jgi:hypothetical protein